MKKFSFPVALILMGPSFLWMACEKSTGPKTIGSLSFSSRYSSTQPPVASWTTMQKVAGAASADSITITRARLVIKDIKFKTTVDSLNFKSGPTVLELNLASGTQTLNVLDVPFADYTRIEFDVHRTQPSEISGMSASEQALFSDFLAGEVYSIIVEGTVYRTPEADTTFVFRSKVDAQQKFDLIPPLSVTSASPVANVTMLVSSGGWFMGPSGLLDPTDINNQSMIDENMKNSIRAFKDNNKDGSKDSN